MTGRHERCIAAAALAAALLTIAGCSSGGATGGRAPTESARPTIARFAGSFDVEPGRSLAVSCWGEGTPTVLYDAGTGTGGIRVLDGTSAVTALAETTRVCSYDRAGLGASGAAPDHPRTVDDLADDLHALLVAADVAGPYVLVGSSGGGFDVYHYAGRYPHDVVGLVMDDVPAPQADIPATDVPAWDGADNPEHMDYALFEHQLAVERLPIPAIPVTVLWATHGQSESQDDQALWLDGSSHPVSIAVDSGHDIMHGNPVAVADAISRMLETLRG